MDDFVRFVRGLVVDLFRSRGALLAENEMLRQQLIVAERKIVGRVRWTPWQRFVMGVTARFTPAWQTVCFLVQPATLLRWHRAGLRAFWRRRSRRPGRPPTPRAALIRVEESEVGSRADSRRAPQTWHPREQANGSAVHGDLSAPRRRAALGDVPEKPRDVGMRFRSDVRLPIPRDLCPLRARYPAARGRPGGGDLRTDR